MTKLDTGITCKKCSNPLQLSQIDHTWRQVDNRLQPNNIGIVSVTNVEEGYWQRQGEKKKWGDSAQREFRWPSLTTTFLEDKTKV